MAVRYVLELANSTIRIVLPILLSIQMIRHRRRRQFSFVALQFQREKKSLKSRKYRCAVYGDLMSLLYDLLILQNKAMHSDLRNIQRFQRLPKVKSSNRRLSCLYVSVVISGLCPIKKPALFLNHRLTQINKDKTTSCLKSISVNQCHQWLEILFQSCCLLCQHARRSSPWAKEDFSKVGQLNFHLLS